MPSDTSEALFDFYPYEPVRNTSVLKLMKKVYSPVFKPFHDALTPWLGEVRIFNLPAHPDDIHTSILGINGQGFSSIEWRKETFNPPTWLHPKWRRDTGVCCPKCGEQIQILFKGYKTGVPAMVTGPHIFCACVRLSPSRLPDLAFFTDNWDTVLRFTDMLETRARELEARKAVSLEGVAMLEAR
jgi:hypothetical protein